MGGLLPKLNFLAVTTAAFSAPDLTLFPAYDAFMEAAEGSSCPCCKAYAR